MDVIDDAAVLVEPADISLLLPLPGVLSEKVLDPMLEVPGTRFRGIAVPLDDEVIERKNAGVFNESTHIVAAFCAKLRGSLLRGGFGVCRGSQFPAAYSCTKEAQS